MCHLDGRNHSSEELSSTKYEIGSAQGNSYSHQSRYDSVRNDNYGG